MARRKGGEEEGERQEEEGKERKLGKGHRRRVKGEEEGEM